MIDQFSSILGLLSNALAGLSPVIIDGDSNAWVVEWGSRLTNTRSWALVESMTRLDEDVSNVGDKHSYSRNGGDSIIDVTFWGPSLNPNSIPSIDDGFTYSDHLAIRYRVEYEGRRLRSRFERVSVCGVIVNGR